MTSYLQGIASVRQTPQSQPIPGREADMSANNAGGYTFTVTALERLRRFLVLGSEGGTYYVGERKLTESNAAAVRAALDAHGVEAVDEIVRVSVEGRAARQDPTIFALAMASAHSNDDVRRAALDNLSVVCRTGTMLFMFQGFVEQFRGRGKMLNRATRAWYLDQPVEKVAYQVVKYRQRDGWSHRDVLRLAKPSPDDGSDPIMRDAIFKVATGDDEFLRILASHDPRRPQDDPLAPLEAYAQAQVAESPQATAALIRHYGGKLPREALKTDHLTDLDVNAALVEQGMPMTALIRNLANLTRYGVLTPMGEYTRMVCEQITDPARLQKSRVHPFNVLTALMTYQSGLSARGSSTWTPVREVVDALDAAFYAAFSNVEATGKRTMLALDVSGSMTWGELMGVPGFTPAVGAAAMAMVTARSEPQYVVFGFGTRFSPLAISAQQRLDDVVRYTSALGFGGTDCSLPMLFAEQEKLPVDTFVVFTDNETYAGRMHPVQALRQYRERMGIDARLIVVGMTATSFSIADPDDAGMLDLVGFDSAAPGLIGEFSAGRI